MNRKPVVRTTPQQAAEMQMLRNAGGRIEAIARRYNVSANSVIRHTTAPKVLNGAVKLGEADLAERAEQRENSVLAGEFTQASRRARLLKLIAEQGPFDNVRDICSQLNDKPGTNVGLHETTHLLWALSKDGEVKFTEDKRNRELSRIRATAQGFNHAGFGAVHREVGPIHESVRAHDEPRSRSDGTDFRNHRDRAEGGPIERSKAEGALVGEPMPGWAALGRREQEAIEDARSAAPTPEPTEAPAPEPAQPERYPELEALMARFAANAEADVKAMKYVAAAEALAEVDPDRSEELLRLATEVGGKPFTALEVEYLLYAERHPR